MEEDIKSRLEAIEKKTEAIYVSVEKTRKYFLWTLIATVVAFVLPLLAAIILVPLMLGPLMSAYSI
jgi:type IV secretory pathway component VirB8